MRRTEQAPGLRLMKFEEVYGCTLHREPSQAAAAEILGTSERTFRRWRDRFEVEGAEGLYDRRLGRFLARRAPVDKVARVLELFDTRYGDFDGKRFHAKAGRHPARAAGCAARASSRSAFQCQWRDRWSTRSASLAGRNVGELVEPSPPVRPAERFRHRPRSRRPPATADPARRTRRSRRIDRSLGCSTSLFLAQRKSLNVRKRRDRGMFAALVACYPWCEPGGAYSLVRPVLILIGGEDDWIRLPRDAARSGVQLSRRLGHNERSGSGGRGVLRDGQGRRGTLRRLDRMVGRAGA